MRKRAAAAGEGERLGVNTPITRRDFLNATLIGAGASLLTLPAPLRLFAAQDAPWDGPGGVGDYAASHGNSEAVRTAGHRLRDGDYDLPVKAHPTGERYDLIIVGAGLTGLGAAHRFKEIAGRRQRCLILENHLAMGGEAKRNEFRINGYRLFGPQGSNSFVVPQDPGEPGYDIYRRLGIPTEFTYQGLDPALDDLWFDTTNFGHLLWLDAPSSGAFFAGDKGPSSPRWIKNFWKDGYLDAPLPAQAKEDIRRLLRGAPAGGQSSDLDGRLDAMTFKAYLEEVVGHPTPLVALLDPILASVMGLGCDAVSAYGARQVMMPGLSRSELPLAAGHRPWHSFPGGNDGICRFLLKAIIPAAIGGVATFPDIHNGPLRREAFDLAEGMVRLRLGSTVARVEHSGGQGARGVTVTYEKEGVAYTVQAGAVLMATGSWVARRAVVGLPDPYRQAYSSFYRSPALVVNVALNNWRFLYRLKLTGCRWFDGFGFSCNIRRPMRVGTYLSPFDPALPIVLTMYVPFYYPGLAIREQGVRGREELLATSFADYEVMIRAQLQRLFGPAGFDPRRDIAGIILNRWGHAYVNPGPGFYFGSNGERAARDLLRVPFERIAFGHSEFNGHQHWVGAVEEGRRGVESLAEFL